MADQATVQGLDSYIRRKHINFGDPKRGMKPIWPVSDSHIRQAIAEGWFPEGIRISPRVTVYRLSEVLAALDKKYAEAKSSVTADSPDHTRE